MTIRRIIDGCRAVRVSAIRIRGRMRSLSGETCQFVGSLRRRIDVFGILGQIVPEHEKTAEQFRQRHYMIVVHDSEIIRIENFVDRRRDHVRFFDDRPFSGHDIFEDQARYTLDSSVSHRINEFIIFLPPWLLNIHGWRIISLADSPN